MTPNDLEGFDAPRDARVVVVGGANADIIGFPAGGLRVRDSNPGRIETSAGGVGRNIAENLVRLGVNVELVTSFGGDADARSLADECAATGIGLTCARYFDELPSARYLAVHDDRNDLAVAINDMRVIELIDADTLGESDCRALLDSADLLVADANLTEAALEFLVESVEAPILIDPVSAPKAGRVRGVLARIDAIKPNAREAAELLGREVLHADDATEAARTFVDYGVRSAFVTVGATGVAWAEKGASGWLPAPQAHITSTAGAGDAFAAGVAYAMLTHAGAREAAMLGSVMAALTLSAMPTVNSALNRDRLLAAMRELWG